VGPLKERCVGEEMMRDEQAKWMVSVVVGG